MKFRNPERLHFARCQTEVDNIPLSTYQIASKIFEQIVDYSHPHSILHHRYNEIEDELVDRYLDPYEDELRESGKKNYFSVVILWWKYSEFLLL